jgi:effector-binding domain-containing protein
MIDKIGVKTTIRELVAYKVLEPGDNEVTECAKLSRALYEKGVKPKDPTMVLFYDPKDEPGCRREVLIPVEREVDGMDTKMMPELRVAFLVFIGTSRPVEHYYEELYKYIEERGLKPSSEMCSIEAVFQPAEYGLSYGSFIDEDTPEHWSTEIMVPVEE